MSEPIGLPVRRPSERRALPAGTFDGVSVFVTGAGTGLGKAIAAEFARLGAAIVIASRKPEHLDAGRGRDRGDRRAGLTVACDIRDADQIAAAFDAAEPSLACPVCWSTTRPRISRFRRKTCRPTRGAPSSTSRSTARSYAA